MDCSSHLVANITEDLWLMYGSTTSIGQPDAQVSDHEYKLLSSDLIPE